jgi:diguanylate cyclase (GGDEF)-like protein
MPTPTDASGETTRLQLLHSLRMLDAPEDERFGRVTRLAKRLFGTPVARVRLHGDEAGTVGSTAAPDPAAALAEDDVFVVHDTSADPRYADHPLLANGEGIRFYAGYPLFAPGGSRVGTFFTVDMVPRLFSVEDMEMLCELGEMVEAELESLTLAVTDELTRLANRRGFLRTAERMMRLCANHDRPAALLLLDLDGLKEINDHRGHEEGDRAIRSFARLLLKSFRHSDAVARLGGDEFCVFAADIAAADLTAPLERLAGRVTAWNAETERGYRLGYSVGRVLFDRERHGHLDDMLREADALMYEQKRSKRPAAG